uniref:RGS domain-containing protein n=1 Tax=Astyanax mexicanus TaxID=7994 RepID=A0A8B9J6T0_ASTMX
KQYKCCSFLFWLNRRGPTLEEVRLWGQTFEQLIKSPRGRASFRQFLKTEFSEENLLFWLACEELKKETNRTAVEQTVKQIYEDYVSILLDSRVREVINKNMMEPSSQTFDDAQQQIYTLMQRDSYPRYINSSMYADLIKSLEEPPTPNEWFVNSL